MINADKKKEMKNLSEMLLETRNLTKQYGHHKAVDSVNMHIKKGAILIYLKIACWLNRMIVWLRRLSNINAFNVVVEG